jgi:hypothetical protein
MNGAWKNIAVWTADGSATVELARMTGPAHGVVDPPVYLRAGPPPVGPQVDLDDTTSKALLYRACLVIGGPFDIYRWVNLEELVRVWRLLDLPSGVAACWTRALHDAGLRPVEAFYRVNAVSTSGLSGLPEAGR